MADAASPLRPYARRFAIEPTKIQIVLRHGTLLLHRHKRVGNNKGNNEMLSTIVIVLLILLPIGALPTWPYSASWGYAPGGALGTVLVFVFDSCPIGENIG
jgi:hypothetical protein